MNITFRWYEGVIIAFIFIPYNRSWRVLLWDTNNGKIVLCIPELWMIIILLLCPGISVLNFIAQQIFDMKHVRNVNIKLLSIPINLSNK